MEANRSDAHCERDFCAEPATAILGSQALCLNHFVGECYRQLDDLDRQVRQLPNRAAELAKCLLQVEEYSNTVLRVCLAEQPLNNVDRGRLLDILLWAGELYVLLREPRARQLQATFAATAKSDRGLMTSAGSGKSPAYF